MYQGIFIDNQKTEKHFASLMSTSGKNGLIVKFQQSAELIKLAKNILVNQPNLVVLESHLNKDYKATPLAQQLRDYTFENVGKDFPIILLSHENKITGYDDDITAHNLFDYRLTKQEVAEHPEDRQKIILSLVKGYQRMIKNWTKKSERWATFFALNKAERVVVAYQAIRELDKLKAPHQVAQHILRYVIKRQGILLDKDNVLAQLGVTKAGNDIEPLFARLKTDKVIYSGVFSEGWTRWWRHRLWDWEKQVCDEALGNLTAKERVACLNEKLELNLSPAESRWQEHTDALFAFACDSCHQPTEQQYSVIAYDHNPVPDSFIQRKHLCWKCIETGEFAENGSGLEIHEDEEFIVEMILNGEMR